MTRGCSPFTLTAALTVLAAVALAGCDDSHADPTPAPPAALLDSRIASIVGPQVHMTDGSIVDLPPDLPRCLLDTPGLTPTDAHSFPGGARLNAVCGEPPAKLAKKLDTRITADAWQITSASGNDTLTHRSYRKGNAVIEITTRAEGDSTHVTTQIESVAAGDVP